MADSGNNSISLTDKTPILGLKLYLVIVITILCLITIFVVIFMFIRANRKSKTLQFLPLVCKDVSEIKGADRKEGLDLVEIVQFERKEKDTAAIRDVEAPQKRSSGSNGSSTSQSEASSSVSAESLNGGWGRWYSLTELETATNRFAKGNVVGEGGYGIVYRGVLVDGSVVAVKNLMNNKGQAEREFKVEVEAIGKVRHKNLVGLIGYCAEGVQRMLVYEYVDNGNLEQWLHGDVGPVSPLSWDTRIKIAVGTAKGLAYLHEGLEPKVVHRDVKSSNILLDRKWNAKVSDFGLAKLLGSEKSYVTTRVMGTFGYVSPDYASTGMLNEGSDVYSFGVLLMEIITGRSPVDYSRTPGEMNLVDWFKGMVSNRRGEELVDPLIQEKPSPRSLKRALLVCLRCIDMDANKRPKMGQIVHLLEAEDFPFRSEHRSTRDATSVPPNPDISTKIPIPGSKDADELRSNWR